MGEKCVWLLLFAYQVGICSGVINGKIVALTEKTDDEYMIIKPYSKEFPYMIEIQEANDFLCGAVLIKKNVVLTAAHCFPQNRSDLDVTNYKVIAGNQIRDDLEGPMVQWRNVTQIILHHQRPNIVSKDLALMQTYRDFDVNDYVKPINLPVGYDKNSFNGQIVVQLGWGTMENGEMSDVLLSMQGFVRPTRSCIFEWYNEYASLNRTHQHSLLCIQGFQRSVQCWGDSGGPTVLHNKNDPSKDILIGILTGVFYFTDGGCNPKRPDIVENVAYFMTWISDTIDKYFKI